MYVYTRTMYLLIRVKSLMGLKFWRSWGVDKPISKSKQVGVFLKIMLNFKIQMGNRCFAIKFSSKWLKMEKSKQVRVFLKNHAQLHFLSR